MSDTLTNTSDDRNSRSGTGTLTPLSAPVSSPEVDLSDILGRLGTMLFPFQPTLGSYVKWSHDAEVFEILRVSRSLTVEKVSSHTRLSIAGADALLGVLCGLGLATRSPTGSYSLTRAAEEYCVQQSPFFIADQLGSAFSPIPHAYLDEPLTASAKAEQETFAAHPSVRFGSRERLRNQHARNLPSCSAAVRSGEFASVSCIIDLAGGSGPFAIPLALEYPDKRILLTELPDALDNVREFLAEHDLDARIELLGFDVFEFPWPAPECDGIFIGNFLHGFDDRSSIEVCREASRCLSAGGKLWLHEMTWNCNKDGPLVTALFNAGMRSAGSGRQRTSRELTAILEQAGFVDSYVVPTAGAFCLIVGRKA